MTLATKKFQRTVEDFTCQHCGFKVQGNGYTNHCPNCLWSKHVDVNPGDRAAGCGGMMRPILVEKKGDGYIITHECEICGKVIRNKAAQNDSIDALSKV